MQIIIFQLVWHILHVQLWNPLLKTISFHSWQIMLSFNMIFFQVSWSCQSNLLSVFNILRDATEHNLEVDLAYLDFAKAFDSVPHRKLIHKLEKYGITLDERFPVEQNTTSTSHLRTIWLGISHWWCLPRECFWSHFICIIYKRFTKIYISKTVSICRRH